VLSKTKQIHPFIYLKGVLHQDLLALMDYMYNGETKVPAEHVDRFIEAAQELKIKGLAEDEVNEVEEKEEETTVPKELYLKEEPSENKEIYVNARLEMEISKIILKLEMQKGKRCGNVVNVERLIKRKIILCPILRLIWKDFLTNVNNVKGCLRLEIHLIVIYFLYIKRKEK